MSDTKRSILACVGALAGIGAIFGGNLWREGVEAGHPLSAGSFVRGILPTAAQSDPSNSQRSSYSGGTSALQPFSELQADRSKDPQISVTDYFGDIAMLLKENYVDPITDDEKLASGGVRGMISSLRDPYSVFMSPTSLKTFRNMQVGKFDGIGAQFAYRMNLANPQSNADGIPEPEQDDSDGFSPSMLPPPLVVVDVVPGGPADKAGVKPGDIVDTVAGHWLIQAKDVMAFRDAEHALSLGKITRDAYASLHRVIRLKVESSILPSRALSLLQEGDSGTVDVKWIRSGSLRETTIAKAPSSIPPFQASGNTIDRLAFASGEEDRFKAAIAGRRSLTIDLRHNVGGDFEVMRRCLSLLVPAGTYGYIGVQRAGVARPFTVQTGVADPPKVILDVDRTTTGAAQVFASILRSRGATLAGSEMTPDPVVVQVKTLPDGSGYTLATGIYSATRPKDAEQWRPTSSRRFALRFVPGEGTV